ncbi:hypothetical protein BJF78_27905 [Pseudonocardia sp. CNS-139]|nr:hypothetical protein BJF78_27905 [Pseudonocardia sp. CNS-139]
MEHIAFTFDPQQMAETLGQGGEAAEAVTTPVPADIWIDGDGRARKFQLRMPVNQEGVAVETDMTIEYFDFGAPVDVQVPDPAQVQDLPTIPTAPR